MNLLALRYFCAVARQGNVTTTANQLHVSQPAVSKAIRGLEIELEVSLFYREPDGVRLTEAGKALYDKTDEALKLLDAGVQAAKNTRFAPSRMLRLVTFHNAAWLSELYLSFQQAHEETQLSLRQLTPQEFFQQERYDFATIPEIYLTPKHESIPLFTEEFLLAVPKSSPLAKRKVVDLVETAPYDYLVMNPDSPAQQFFQAVCQLVQFQPRVTVECNSITTFHAFLAAGRGIAFVPAHSSLRDYSSLTFLRIRQPSCTRTIHLCWLRSQPLDETRLLFRDFCRDYVVQHLENHSLISDF